jgi:predicted transcriptional regulator of viral defense system
MPEVGRRHRHSYDDGEVIPTPPTSWRDDLLMARDARTDAARTDLARRAATGELTRISTGVYFPAERWRDFSARERYLLRACVVSARAADPITFSHATAAAIWGLPWLGPWPDRVDVVRTEPGGGQYALGVSRHRMVGDLGVEQIDGLRVTSLARTVVDIARQPGFMRAVVVGDAAMSGRLRLQHASASATVSRAALLEQLEQVPLAATRARDAVRFFDPGAESPGESISRVSLWRAGFPSPVLQQKFGAFRVDFWWPDSEVIGEFDGRVKYLDAGARGGQSADEIVYAEKLREDELRRQCRGFARWSYTDAMSPAALRARLQDAGLPPQRRARFAAVAVL